MTSGKTEAKRHEGSDELIVAMKARPVKHGTREPKRTWEATVPRGKPGRAKGFQSGKEPRPKNGITRTG